MKNLLLHQIEFVSNEEDRERKKVANKSENKQLFSATFNSENDNQAICYQRKWKINLEWIWAKWLRQPRDIQYENWNIYQENNGKIVQLVCWAAKERAIAKK